MATLNLTNSEFADIVMIWLFDNSLNPEQIQNEKFKEFIDTQGSKIKPALIKYYLDSGSEARFRYKRIKGIFDGSDTSSIHQIRISNKEDNTKEEKENNNGIVKKIIKKLIKKEELDLDEINFIKEINE